MSNAQIDRQLAALYARVPKMECKGLCQDSCAGAKAYGRELRRVELSSKRKFLCGESPRSCSMLEDGRCVAYRHRPMICRIWGLASNGPCPHGCVPEGGHLTPDEVLLLVAEAEAIAGREGAWELLENVREGLRDPAIRELALALMGQGAFDLKSKIER